MNVRQILRGFLAERFPGAAKLKDDEPLLEKGILDSLGIMRLVAFLESKFGIRVKDRDIVPEIFRSVDTLAAYVEKQRKRSKPSSK
jgi:acyl carrier protein